MHRYMDISMYIHACMHSCMHAYKDTLVHRYIHTYICMCIYMYMYICMYMCDGAERGTEREKDGERGGGSLLAARMLRIWEAADTGKRCLWHRAAGAWARRGRHKAPRLWEFEHSMILQEPPLNPHWLIEGPYGRLRRTLTDNPDIESSWGEEPHIIHVCRVQVCREGDQRGTLGREGP